MHTPTRMHNTCTHFISVSSSFSGMFRRWEVTTQAAPLYCKLSFPLQTLVFSGLVIQQVFFNLDRHGWGFRFMEFLWLEYKNLKTFCLSFALYNLCLFTESILFTEHLLRLCYWHLGLLPAWSSAYVNRRRRSMINCIALTSQTAALVFMVLRVITSESL